MEEKKIYLLIIPKAEKIGGAEKRFLGMWEYLVTQNKKYVLITTKEIYTISCKDATFQKIAEKYAQNILFFEYKEHKNKLEELVYFRNFIYTTTEKNATLHFICEFFTLPLLHRKVIYSVTCTSFKMYNTNGKIAQYVGMLMADKIDILDPTLYSKIPKYYFFKKNKFYNTTCSYCDMELYYPKENKKKEIVFLGKFNAIKQAVNYVKAIPAMHNKLVQSHIQIETYYLIGFGPDEQEIETLLQKEEYKNIPIVKYFEPLPHKILNESDVFLSLQRYSNYPSRSLIEAMAAGNIPIVTDCGDTKKLADDSFSYYVPEFFDTEHLVNAIEKVYTMPFVEKQKKQALARKHIEANFTLDKMTEYYINLYKD